MTNEHTSTDAARESIRLKLNADKIKLWLPPYTAENGEKGQRPDELIAQYSTSLGLPEDVVATVIEELRDHAFRKLKDRLAGLVTIKVKFAGQTPSNLSSGSNSASSLPELTVEVNVTSRGIDLKQQISAASGIPHDYLKLISAGRVVDDDAALDQQQIRNNSNVMALCLSEPEVSAIQQQQQQQASVDRMREAAELLNSHDDYSDYSMQIADQSGRPIDLPRDERKALMLAMMLHEKGRSALKRKEFGEALIFLLEADAEFKKCRSSILSLVDNYAIVCLDVVWCYLCLQNISALPDAEVRLKACETCFHKSYGANLERLNEVKGSTAEEGALFVRLHILQAILAFHQQKYNTTRDLLLRAEGELNMLRINMDDMTRVMEMGFTEIEARLGLRACRGNIQNAVTHIMHRREERKLQEEKEREERRRKRLVNKLGKTAGGDPVNIEHYESLVSMKFAKGAAAEALRQANNDITIAFQILHERPELLNLPDPDPPNFTITDEMVEQLSAMGFDPDTSHAALHHFHANLARAVEELVRLGGIVPPEWLLSLPQVSPAASNSDTSTASSSMMSTSSNQKRERELMEEIIPDISHNEEDYLDITLDDEAALLQEYKGRLLSLG